MAESERGTIPQAGLIIGSVVGVLLLIPFIIVGLTDHGPSDSPHFCGSVLGGGAGQLTALGQAACDRILGAPAIWTWTLLALAGLAFLVGLLVTTFAMYRTRPAQGLTTS